MNRPRPQFRVQDYSQWLSNPQGKASTGTTPTGQDAINDAEIERRAQALVADGQVVAKQPQKPREQAIRVGGRTVQVVHIGKGLKPRDAQKARMAGLSAR